MNQNDLTETSPAKQCWVMCHPEVEEMKQKTESGEFSDFEGKFLLYSYLLSRANGVPHREAMADAEICLYHLLDKAKTPPSA